MRSALRSAVAPRACAPAPAPARVREDATPDGLAILAALRAAIVAAGWSKTGERTKLDRSSLHRAFPERTGTVMPNFATVCSVARATGHQLNLTVLPTGGPRFRKRPVEIEAFQMTAEHRADAGYWPAWLLYASEIPCERPGAVFELAGSLLIHTLEGIMAVGPNDWIIRGVQGEVYACKPDVFAATYEAVE